MVCCDGYIYIAVEIILLLIRDSLYCLFPTAASMVEYLIEKGADVNVKDEFSRADRIAAVNRTSVTKGMSAYL